jgi:hypothetical protein
MAEVVQLFMQAAGSEKAIIYQAVPDDTQAPAETAVIAEKLAYAAVHSPSARVAFDSHTHRHTPASGLQESLSQCLIPEIIRHPKDFTSGWHCKDAVFQEIAQAA